ncbi:NADPH-dependent FMN reductase [Streptomyces sp. NBC_01669]|uniref:NADPH-dependent FMN reductase n=1 Tax=Streptomyces sp. NBC_01669 TaxID=2975909 RepID=UPI00225A69D0|nr:NAD(P)H-dependent oxidoreductase [Streptomyces sp. NBC_01669]MCX4538233.1 NAD(P)H-dependent oxidoreductase [Streptomyces sp. NBC_01669]
MTTHEAASTVFAVSGSLRSASLNSRLLDEVQKLAPGNIKFDVFDGLANLPHFNEDQEFPAPQTVQDLRSRVQNADGILIATPEYSASIPGALKNAIDWLSRAYDGAPLPLAGKPTAIIGASQGPLGSVRAQLTLRQILHKVDAAVVRQPEFLLPTAHVQLESGLAEDSASAQILRAILAELQVLIKA